MNKNCYQLFESKLNMSATSLSTAAQYRQTCSKLIQFRLKKLIAIFAHYSTALVWLLWKQYPKYRLHWSSILVLFKVNTNQSNKSKKNWELGQPVISDAPNTNGDTEDTDHNQRDEHQNPLKKKKFQKIPKIFSIRKNSFKKFQKIPLKSSEKFL